MSTNVEIKIEKLNSNNYYKWKEDIKYALTIRDWWCAVQQTAEWAALDVEPKRIRSQQAFAGLVMTISSDLRSYVSGKTTAKEVWDELAELFKKKSLGDKRILQKELQALRCKKGEDVLTYVSRARTLRTQLLDACGVNTPDSQLVDILLDGLGNEYADFKSHVNYSDAALSLDEFVQKLHSASAAIRKSKDEPAHAFVAYKPGQGAPRKAPFKPRGRCHNCKKLGHWARDCPDKKQMNQQSKAGPKHFAFSATVTCDGIPLLNNAPNSPLSDTTTAMATPQEDVNTTSGDRRRRDAHASEDTEAASIALLIRSEMEASCLPAGLYSSKRFRRMIHFYYNSSVKFPELQTGFELMDKQYNVHHRPSLPANEYPYDGFNSSDDDGDLCFDEIKKKHSEMAATAAVEANVVAATTGHNLVMDVGDTQFLDQDDDENDSVRKRPRQLGEASTHDKPADAGTDKSMSARALLSNVSPEKYGVHEDVVADFTAAQLNSSHSTFVAGALKAPVHHWSSPHEGMAGVIEFSITHGDDDVTYNETMVCDAGSQHHIISSASLIKPGTLQKYPSSSLVEIHGVGGSVRAIGTCTCDMYLGEAVVTLSDVLYAPDAKVNLMSVSQACADNTLDFIFNYDGVFVEGPGFGRTRLGRVDNRLYKLVCSVSHGIKEPVNESTYLSAHERAYVASVSKTSLDLMHRRLGHISHPVLENMVRAQCAHGLPEKYNAPNHKCDICLRAKQARPPFDEHIGSATHALELVHADVMGPFQETSLGGSKYALVILDDYSRYASVKCLEAKSDVPEALLSTLVYWANQLDARIRVLRTDRGSEFCNKTVDGFCTARGVLHQLSAAYTPQQNGRVERINRTLMDRGRALLIDSELPNTLWAEALMTGLRIYNVTLPVRQPATPFELFWKRRPAVAALRVFGCKAYVQKPAHQRKKLDDRGIVGTLVGYSLCSKAYRVLHMHRDKNGRLAVTESRNVVFDESCHGPFVDPLSYGGVFADVASSMGELPNIPELGVVAPGHHQAVAPADAIPEDIPFPDDEDIAEDTSSTNGNTGSSSEEAPPEPGPVQINPEADQIPENQNLDQAAPILEQVPDDPVHEQLGSVIAPDGKRHSLRHQALLAKFKQPSGELTDDPQTLAECQARRDWPQWREAMQAELDSLIKHGTFSLVPKSIGMALIPTKWVFKVKRDEKGRIDKYKARIVAKGFKQIAGRDYSEVYAPVGRHTTFRALLTEVVLNNLELIHLDVRTAFLNGELEEEIYVTPPPGYISSKNAWLLHKALYGLKQAGRAWHLHLKAILKEMGLTVTYSDESLYIFQDSHGSKTYLLVYVDDLLLAGHEKTVFSLKEKLEERLDIHDLGNAKHFLGMEILRDRKNGNLWLGQKQNAQGVLEKFGMQDSKPRKTPMDANLPLKAFDGKADTDVLEPYQSLVGSLLYLANCTRPDISQPVGVLSRFMSNPSAEHLSAAKQVLRYLRGTADLGLLYTSKSANLIGYCDADYAGDLDKRKSTSGFVFLRAGAAIAWSSKLQPTVAFSTCEAEFISTAAAIKEALWLRNLLGDFEGQVKPVLIFGDNQGALKLLHHPHAHQRTKHIDVAHRFAQDRVERGEIQCEYIQTNAMVADCTTKVVPLKKFEENRKDMGMSRWLTH